MYNFKYYCFEIGIDRDYSDNGNFVYTSVKLRQNKQIIGDIYTYFQTDSGFYVELYWFRSSFRNKEGYFKNALEYKIKYKEIDWQNLPVEEVMKLYDKEDYPYENDMEIRVGKNGKVLYQKK